MDGDLPRRRSAPPGALHYSATLPATAADPVTARAEAPTRTRPAPRPDDEDDAPDDKTSNKNGDNKESGDDAKPPAKKTPGWKRALYWIVGLLVLAALIVGGILYWLHARQFESTDDAFIDGNMSQVSAQVAARVTRIAIEDNQFVDAGQTLIELDPRDYRVRLDQARAQRTQAAAQLDQSRAQLTLQQANYDQALAQVRVAQADLQQQQTDLNRYRAIDPKAITRQQLDTSSAQTKAASARVDAAKQTADGARAQIEAQKAAIEASEANLIAADVGVANAELQLSYTTVTAPQAGRVAKRTVQLGNYVNPGQALLAVVPEQMWVTANFKETQLALMRPGQHVRVQVDACPDQDIGARVDSFQRGTGAVFSSLPAENATGNYVKVVQRVPVKLVFDDPARDGKIGECRLALGLSVVPRVTVR